MTARPAVKVIVGILLFVIGCLAIATYAGEYLVVDDPRPSDLALVIAGDDWSRVPKGIVLLRGGTARELVLDADSAHRWLGRTDAERLVSQLSSAPDIAAHIRVCPITAASTMAETKDFERCVDSMRIKRIVIVTSAFHTRRALSTFQHALPQYEWSAAAVHDENEFGTPCWRHLDWLCTAVDEWEKLIWWECVERWT